MKKSKNSISILKKIKMIKIETVKKSGKKKSIF